MTDISELVVRIRADAAQLQQELAKATQSTQQAAGQMSSAFDAVKSSLAAIGIGLSVGSLVEFTRGALDAANNMYILSQRTGIAASTFSALNIPLQQNGSSVDEFASSIKFLQRNIENANPAAVKAFTDIGLSVTKLRDLDPQEQFVAVANALGVIDNQGRLVSDTLATMGRNAIGLVPAMKAAAGDMQGFIDAQDKLTNEDIQRVHDADDKWTSFFEHMKMNAVEAALALKDLATAQRELRPEDTLSGAGNYPAPKGPKAPPASYYLSPDYQPGGGQAGTAQFDRDGNLKAPDSGWHSTLNFDMDDKSAKGNNDDLPGGAQDKAKQATQSVQDYIQSLKDETAALSLGKEALAEYRAEKAAAAAAGEQIKDLTPDQISQIKAEADAYEQATEKIKQQNEEKQKQIAMTAQLEAQISSSLADIATNYKNMGQTVTQVLDQIAKKVTEDFITTPLVNQLGQIFGASDTSGKTAQSTNTGFSLSSIFSFLPHFAGGGQPPVNSPSLVGENGPELFVPNSAGTIVPNGGFGGSNVIVQQSINLSPGLAETVNAAIMQATPRIAAFTHASVMQAISKGGTDAKVVGLRQ